MIASDPVLQLKAREAKLAAEYHQWNERHRTTGGAEARDRWVQAAQELKGVRSELRSFTWGNDGPDAPVKFDPKAYSEVKTAGTTVKVWHPAAVDQKDYASAFEAYVSKLGNVAALGPNDRKTLSEGVDTAGGFMVDRTWLDRVVSKMVASVAIFAHATRIPVTSGVASFPRVVNDADDQYSSAVRFSWTGELPASATTARSPEPTIGQVTMPLHTALASLLVSRDLLEDSDISGLLTKLLGDAYAAGEGSAYIVGDGIAKPLGILANVDQTHGPVSVPSGTSGAISTAADAWSGKRILDLWAALPSQYRQNAAFVMNSGTAETVENLVDAQKRPVMREVTGAGFPTMGADSMIKSRPILYDEFAPAIAANAFPILFGDLSGYVIAERVGLSIRILQEPYVETNAVSVLARRRVTGLLAEAYRVKALKCA